MKIVSLESFKSAPHWLFLNPAAADGMVAEW